MDLWNKHNLLYRVSAVVLIVLHLVTFGPIRDALAFSATSTSYALDAQFSQGGQPRQGDTLKISNDIIGEPFTGGEFKGTTLVVSSGLVAITKIDPPVAKVIPAQTWLMGESKDNAFDLDDYFSSPTNLALTYSVSNNGRANSKIRVYINPTTHQVSFSQEASWFGVERIKFCAADSEGNVTFSDYVALQVVSSTSVNSPAIVEIKLEPLKINEGNLVKLIVKARDYDGSSVNFVYGGNPLFSAGIPVWDDSAKVWVSEATWQSTVNSKGTYNVSVTARNASGLEDTENISINVSKTNHTPQIAAISDINASEGNLVNINPTISDADNDTVNVYYPPPFDTTGRWTPGYNDAGTYDLTLTAYDGIDTATKSFKVIVANTNRPPVVNLTLGHYTVRPNEDFDILLSASDPDSEDNTLSFSLKKDDVEFDSGTFANNGTYHKTTSFANTGYYKIKAEVRDTLGLVALKEVNVQVDNTNPEVSPLMGDFDGNCRTDLGIFDSREGKWEVALAQKGGEFQGATRWMQNDFSKSRNSWPIGGDFDGDSKTDTGVYNALNHQLQIALSNGINGFSVDSRFNLNLSFSSYNWQPFSGNFNGDKYTDIAFYNRDDGDIRVFLGKGDGFQPEITVKTRGSAGYSAMGGDFNGDGLTDLCLYKKDNGEVKIAFSNSFAFSNGENDFVDGFSWTYTTAANHDLLISDFNNDGLGDIGYWNKDSSKWYYAIGAAGNTFIDKGLWLENFGVSTDQSATTGDFNGDGINDAAAFNRDKIGVERWSLQISTNKPADLITRIDNGIGGYTDITYTYASSEENNDLPFPVYVASSTSSVDTLPVEQLQETYSQDFKFCGGYYDAGEREFRGFKTVRVTDRITGNYTETEFYQGKTGEEGAVSGSEGAYKGQIKKISAYIKNDNGSTRQISEAVNTYEVKKAGPQDRNLGFPSLKEQITKVFDDDNSTLTTRSSFIYDNIGNVLEEKSEGDLAKTGDEKSTSTTYAQAYAVGFNRPLETALKDKDGGVVTKKTLEYDERGNLAKEVVDIINPIEITTKTVNTKYTYDICGNNLSVTNSLGKTITTEYETSFHAYPKKITNALGHTISYTYDPKFGIVKSTTDANGEVGTNLYDSFGRTTQVKNALNQVIGTTAYPDFNTKITTNAIGLSKTEYADGLGRKYKTESVSEDGDVARKVISETFFSNRGFTDRESLPHYENENPDQISYIRYEYDNRGRVVKTISDFPGEGKDAESSVKYWNTLKTETVDPRGNSKITIKDIYGNIKEIIEPGNLHTYYEYDLQNNLTKTTDARGNIVQIFYDSLGRKIKMIDPDMGTWLYEYDLIGNLKKQTDAKGQILTFNYDALNRLIEKRGLSPSVSEGPVPAVLASYQYDDTSKDNCIGRLSKVSDQSGSTEFFYDRLGREIQSKKTVGSSQYVVGKEYDIVDRLIKLTYPDGEEVNYIYDANSGLLEKVQGNSVYVDDTAYNAKGQIKNIKYGNGAETQYTYGSDLRLDRIFTQSAAQTLQDLNYTFDKNGNVATLTDNLHNNIRSYTYDNLDRLTKAQNSPDPLGGYTDFNYEYDSIGNMTSQTKANGSGLGTMRYGQNAGPHALTSAGGYTYLYDANGNMTQGKNKAMSYGIENRLTQVTESSGAVTNFIYDGDGGRVKKTEIRDQKTESTTYIGSLYEVDSDGKATKYIFAGSNRVASVSLRGAGDDETVSFYHSDHLGSSNVISDSSGALAQYCDYTPYGTTARNEGADITHHKFTGKELDSTELYYYGARYYDPEIGRFITADTIVQEPYNSQSLNRYAYCFNNPLNYVDPTGHWSWKKFWNSFAGAVVGAIVTVLTAGAGAPLWIAGMVGGMIGGALSGGLEGGWKGALIGGAIGGALGAFGGWGVDKFGWGFGVGMLAAGAGYAGATDSWDGFTGGLTGGICGAGIGNGILGVSDGLQTTVPTEGEMAGKGPSENQKWSGKGWGTDQAGARQTANNEGAVVFWRQDRGLIGNFVRSSIERFHASAASRQFAQVLKGGTGVVFKPHSDFTIITANSMKILRAENVRVSSLHIDFNAPGIAESTVANLSKSIGATYHYYLNSADPIGVVTTFNPAKQATYGILGIATLARDHGVGAYPSASFNK